MNLIVLPPNGFDELALLPTYKTLILDGAYDRYIG